MHESTPAELKARIGADRAGNAFLALRDAGGAQRLIELDPAAGAVSVGRDAAAAIRVEWDSKVSRLHAALERIGPSWTAADDGLSRNGTFVNSSRVSGRCRLSAGDVIQMGDTSISFFEPVVDHEAETSRGDDVTFDAAVKTQLRALFAKFSLSDLPQNRKRAALAEAALRSGAVARDDLGSD